MIAECREVALRRKPDTARLHRLFTYYKLLLRFICILWRVLHCRRKQPRRFSAITARVLLGNQPIIATGRGIRINRESDGSGAMEIEQKV